MSAIWGTTAGGTDLRRAVLEAFARTEPCEPCEKYADELVEGEIENRCDPVLNRLGLPYPDNG
jgi:ketosteroid isomerase-like protein